MVSGSRKYPSDTSRLRPCNGAQRNSQSCTPISDEVPIKPSSSIGFCRIRLSRPVISGQSLLSSMNRVRQGRVSRVRQPKTSSPSSGVNSEV
ncbi:hypothetical protein D3C72_1753440 [compost metagenome]